MILSVASLFYSTVLSLDHIPVIHDPLFGELPTAYAQCAKKRGLRSEDLSFPIYEESSLQDGLQPSKPYKQNRRSPASRPVLILSAGARRLCARCWLFQHPPCFLQDVFSSLMVPVHHMPAYRADIRPVGQGQLLMDMAAGNTGLAGREPPAYPYQVLPLPVCLILQHLHEHAPAVIRYGFPELQGPLER